MVRQGPGAMPITRDPLGYYQGVTDVEQAGDGAMTDSRHRNQIKTRERVRDLAEVYTHEREVNAMLDLIPDGFTDIDTRFLETSRADW